jgi:glycerol uptake operon antiterminator
MKIGKVIAAVKSEKAMIEACKSNVEIIFDLAPSIADIESKVMICQKHGKALFIHIDLAEGIGKDKAGLKYVKDCGVDGVISTRASLIKSANDVGLMTVQRIFLLDSQSIDTAIELFKSKPSMVEVMPGVVAPRVISRICSMVEYPVIAGGLIEDEAEVDVAISAGAIAVSTGKSWLWK